MKLWYKREFVREFGGTFLLVLFGCGAVTASVLFDAFQSLLGVSLVWGIGVSLSIYASRHLSCAHLNPAVTLAMVASRRMKIGKMPVYLAAQFLGAVMAGLILFMLFEPSITAFENANAIVRGPETSVMSARIFGDYYQLPYSVSVVSMPLAFLAEAFGTFLLVLMIFSLTEGCNLGKPGDNIAPIFIGLTVTSIICLVAPLTQAGLNPARDLGPRLVAWIFGWGSAAFPDNMGGFFWVYVLGPITGGQTAALLFTKVIEPLMNQPKEVCARCGCDIQELGGESH